ncbi:hypothetical protein FRB98_003807, partial [Tulasnella sp. 332]
AGLGDYFWSAAVLYLVYILNVTPSTSVFNTTLFEVWHRYKPDLCMYQTFGCHTYANIERKDRKGFAPHTQKAIFVGFEPGFKGWKLYNPKKKETFISQDVIFNKNNFPGTSTKDPTDPDHPLGIQTFWPKGGYSDDDDVITSPPDNQGPSRPPPPPQNSETQLPSPPHTPPSSPTKATFLPSWDEDQNTTGRPMTKITPPRPPKEEPFTPISSSVAPEPDWN